jgi:hypothetical protein
MISRGSCDGPPSTEVRPPRTGESPVVSFHNKGLGSHVRDIQMEENINIPGC